MNAREIYNLGLDKLKTFDLKSLLPALRFANQGAIGDVMNTNGCANYQWSSCIAKELKPKQTIELGGAMGVWSICMLHNLPSDCKLFSITLPENGLEFSYIKDNYPNLVKVLGNDLTQGVWPKDLDLSKTDLWFFDSEHSEMQLNAELKIYESFFKKGTILLFDDIHINPGMELVWEGLKKKYDSWDCTDPLHYSGFGLCII